MLTPFQVDLNAMKLNEKQKFKFKKIVGERYDPKTDRVIFECNR